MKCNYCIHFCFLFVLFISCNKHGFDNGASSPEPAPPAKWEWFKLIRVDRNSQTGFYKFKSKDTTEILLDSVNNTIVLKKHAYQLNGAGFDKDTSVEKFTYNSQHQLILYEHTGSGNQLYITRMEFVRNPAGLLTKVLSQYNNGLVNASEGIIEYSQHRDTLIATYIDSTRKHPLGNPDAQDFYQVWLVNNKEVYRKTYSMAQSGKWDSTMIATTYDAEGNVASVSSQFNNNSPVQMTYRWDDTQPSKDLQRFLTQWPGDLYWFTRSKLFSFSGWHTISPASGKALFDFTDGVKFMDFSKADFNGANYNSIVWQLSDRNTGTGISGSPDVHVEHYVYR